MLEAQQWDLAVVAKSKVVACTVSVIPAFLLQSLEFNSVTSCSASFIRRPLVLVLELQPTFLPNGTVNTWNIASDAQMLFDFDKMRICNRQRRNA